MATILIVDDSPSNREFLVALLGKGGHRLLEAGDGAEALAVVRAEHPDLVIADILMPTMDGARFVRLLRADPSITHTPVIFCTAHYHEPEALALARACGISSVFTKPSHPEKVLQVVEAALGMSPPPSSPETEEFDREHLRLVTGQLTENLHQLQRTNYRLQSLLSFGLDLGSERDPQRLLQSFCHAARKLTGARYAVTGIVAGDGSQVLYYFTSGMDAETAAQFGAPDPSKGAIATVLGESRCLRQHHPGGEPVEVGFASPAPPIHSWLGAPIVSPGRVYGWLHLVDKLGAAAFGDEDERLVGILATQVGQIYEKGSLYTDLLDQKTQLDLKIAERQQAEDALRASEERIRLLLDSTAEAIYGRDLLGRCTFCNAASIRLLGYAETGQILGKDMHVLIHHTRRDGTPNPREECPIYQSIEKGEGSHIEDEIFWRADGTSFPAEYWSYPIRRGGQVVGSVVTFLDITERKKFETQFRQAQQRLEHVIASSPAMLYTLEFGGENLITTWVSENLREMLGYAPEEALGRTWFNERVHPEDLPRVMNELQHDLLDRDRLVQEYRFRHQDGKYRWLRDEKRLLRDAAGKPVEVVGSWADITERKLLEDQFRQAQKMEAVGRLAGGVAHDFNNLLTVITGYSELVLGQLRAADPLHGFVEQIRQAGDRAAGLTRQLLAFSRKQVLMPATLDLNFLMKEMEKMLHRLIGEDIDLLVNPHVPLWPIKADPGQVEQVLMNLVVNSRDAMPQGGKLTIETGNVVLDASYVGRHPEVQPGEYVQLSVSDTGCGMDAATQARIFEPFFSTKGDKGTGLGLATVYGIVKQSGGSIDVYSELGVGTAFKIYLPHDREQRAESKSSPGLKATTRGTETVLLAEDEPGVRSLAKFVLESNGYMVLEAKNGGEALLLCEQYEGPIHMLVTDVVMPQLSGPKLAERLLALRPKMKVLYLSGYTDDAIVHHGVLNSGTPFLQKPFTPASLALKVREVLDSSETPPSRASREQE